MQLPPSRILDHLTEMDEYEFEHFVGDLWERQGWDAVVTQASNDGGVDVVVEKTTPFHTKHVLQVKRYDRDNRIGAPDIREYSSLRHREDDVDAVVVVTTSSFTSAAEREAGSLNVKLIDGTALCGMIADANAGDLLREYTELGSRDGRETRETSGDTSPGRKVEETVEPQTTSTDDAEDAERGPRSDQNAEENKTHPFDDHTLADEDVSKSDFFGSRCPVCSEYQSVWEQTADSREGRRFKCEGCDTYWEPVKTLVFRKKKWKATTGPKAGTSKTTNEWRNG